MKKISKNVLLFLPVLSLTYVVCGQEFRVRDGLANFFGKLQAGKQVRIAYLGGSITAQEGWRPKTLKWFQQQYPNATISEINAAIGGTGSDLGVFRLEHDVLRHKPDLLFVEFAVNDGGAPPHRIQQAMEGIVRQTYAADAETDICFVYTLVAGWTKTLRDGKFPRAASAMEAVADHYGIPSIHMGLEVAKMEGEGKLIFTAAKPQTDAEKAAVGNKIIFSPDGVHPYTDRGHELYLQAVVRAMESICKVGKPKAHALGEPLVADNWKAAKMVTLDKANLTAGWRRLDASENRLAKQFGNRMQDLYFTNQPGESISIRFRGSALSIYDLLGPDCGQVLVKVDGKEGKIVPRFDAYCTYHRLATLTVAENLPEVVHTVKLQLSPDQPDKAKILAKRNQNIDDSRRYDDTAWYVGAILLIGEIVE